MPVTLVKTVRESLQRNNRVQKILKLEDTDEKQKQLILMASNKSFREQSWSGWLVIPLIILTFLGNIPNWVVLSFWAITVTSLLNEIICISSRDYIKTNEMTKRVYFSAFCIMATLPLTIAMMFYSVFRALSLL